MPTKASSSKGQSAQHMGMVLAGDGIASRAMALAFAKMGIASTIIAPKEQVLTGGVQIAPNGWAALKKLGLGEDAQDPTQDLIKNHALALSMMRVLSLNTGYNLVQIPLNDRARRQPYTSMTRQGLNETLKKAAQKTKKVTWENAAITAVTSKDNKAEITLDDGKVITADWLIGGDGSHGICRQYVAAETSPSKQSFTRQAFRIVIPGAACPPTLMGKASNLWLGDGSHMVHYPLADGMLNLVAVMPKAASIDDLIHLTRQHPQGSFLTAYIRDNGDHVYSQPLYQHQSLDAFQRGRVILCGDAAHPMPPHLAQGAGQSLIDAAHMMALAQSLNISPDDDLQVLFTRWAADRNRQVKSIRRNAERAGAIFAIDGPLAKLRNFAMASIGGKLLTDQLESLWAE